MQILLKRGCIEVEEGYINKQLQLKIVSERKGGRDSVSGVH